MPSIRFELEGEHIALNDLLKVAGVAASGSAGKALVACGAVQVDGRTETRKTCKIRAGQEVVVGRLLIRVEAARAPPSNAAGDVL